MLLIFVDKISERLIYSLDFIFKDRGINYHLTNDWHSFLKSEKLKFNYSENKQEQIVQIQSSTVLFDEAIFNYNVKKSSFFKEECLSFDSITDPIASIFYILSRYEEHLVKLRDEHDRFEAKNSILLKFDWLEKVICDRISEDIIQFLEIQFSIKFDSKPIPFNMIPTFDIDNTFAFKWKDGIRKVLSQFKDKIKNDKLRINARKAFELGNQTDPYDTFDIIKDISISGFEIKIFWLIGEYSKFDKNISVSDKRHQQLIQEMSKFGEIGLHPSYKSNESVYILKNEQEILQKILKHKPTISRQHFLKLNLPSTYNHLISLGFKEDYTMGFSDQVGFRSGTSRPHLFFDVLSNQTSTFLIHPFAYMDGTLNQYLKISPEFSKLKIKKLVEEVKKYGGDFCFIWHNETISEFGIWKGWKSVFDYTLSLK